jgi:hypothetical protein
MYRTSKKGLEGGRIQKMTYDDIDNDDFPITMEEDEEECCPCSVCNGTGKDQMLIGQKCLHCKGTGFEDGDKMQELSEGDILQVDENFIGIYTKKREHLEGLELVDVDLDYWEAYGSNIKLVGITTERHESLIKEKNEVVEGLLNEARKMDKRVALLELEINRHKTDKSEMMQDISDKNERLNKQSKEIEDHNNNIKWFKNNKVI